MHMHFHGAVLYTEIELFAVNVRSHDKLRSENQSIKAAERENGANNSVLLLHIKAETLEQN